MFGGRRWYITWFWWGDPKEVDHDLRVDGKIILKWIIKNRTSKNGLDFYC